MTTLSIPSFLTPLPAGLSATNHGFMLAGADKLYVATAEEGGFASLANLPLAPRLGEAPGGYHPFSEEKMDRARRWFRSQAGDLKISPDRAEALGEKLLANLRCIDPITFKQALIQMGLSARKFIGDSEYGLVINRPYRSHWFVYQALVTMGFIPPANAVYDFSDSIFSFVDRDKNDIIGVMLGDVEVRNRKIIILDDCVYNGHALMADDVLKNLKKRFRGVENVFVGLVGCAQKGWNLSFLSSVSHYVGLRINYLGTVFDCEEREILKRPVKGSEYGILPFSDIRPSTLTWYKLPDNMNNPLEVCGLKTWRLVTDEAGNQVLPNAHPLYYEIFHPDLLASSPSHERHRLRIEIQAILMKEGPEGVAEFLQFVSTKLK